nr:hypothetical protein CFP56_00294 [Quercus suber]
MASSKHGQRQDGSFSQQWMNSSTGKSLTGFLTFVFSHACRHTRNFTHASSPASSTQAHPFGYIPLPPDSSSSQSDNSLHQSSILSNQESHYLGAFLDNPDFFRSMDPGIKQEHESYDNPYAFGDGSAMLSNHFGSAQAGAQRPQSHASNYYPSGQSQVHGAYDDSSAAHSLLGMSNPQHSQAAMSWGNFSAPNGLPEASATFTATLPNFNASNMRANNPYNQPAGFSLNQQVYHQDASQHLARSSRTPQPRHQDPANFFHFGHTGTPTPSTSTRTPNLGVLEARFGTDDSFGSTGYRGSIRNTEHEKYANLNSMPLADRAAAYTPDGQPLAVQRRESAYNLDTGGERSQSAKRRKTKLESEEDEDYLPERKASEAIPKRGPQTLKSLETSRTTPNKIAGPRRKSAPNIASARPPSTARSYNNDSPSPDAVGSLSPGDSGDMNSTKKRQRARGSDAGAAPGRQNLSDEQKRENHIKSEQKRRNIIKQGYNDLNRMVPSLAGGRSGLSKAELLKEAIMYIEECVMGNKALAYLLPSIHKSEDAQIGTTSVSS